MERKIAKRYDEYIIHMNKILIANWKMKPTTLEEVVHVASACDTPDVIIAPPAIFFDAVHRVAPKAILAVQTISDEDPVGGGAYTGEISATMAKASGAAYAIVGHSERRQYNHETDAQIAKKVVTAYTAGIQPVLCVGERKEVRARGFIAAQEFVQEQLRNNLSLIYTSAPRIIVAYEPIWAIGTGDNATPQQAVDMAIVIKKMVTEIIPSATVSVLYGGSVTGENAEQFLQKKEIDGLLVGGASVNVDSFSRIITSARNA